MSTVSTVKTLVDFYLGASNAYGDSDKLTALNESRKHILMNYDVDEFIIPTDLTFSSGAASIPSDYLRWVKMYDSTDPTIEYKRKNINDFDKNITNTWTIKADINDGNTRKMFIYPSDKTAARLRYVQLPADLSSNSDDTGFNPYWDSAHAAWSAWWIFVSDRQDAALTMIEVAKELSDTAMRTQDNEIESNTSVSTVFDDDVSFFDEDQ